MTDSKKNLNEEIDAYLREKLRQDLTRDEIERIDLKLSVLRRHQQKPS